MDYYMKLYAPDIKNSIYNQQFSGSGKKNNYNNLSVLKQHGLNVINSVKQTKNFKIDFNNNSHLVKHHSPTRINHNRGNSSYLDGYLNDYLPKIFSQSLERNRANYDLISENSYKNNIIENFLDIDEGNLYNFFTFISIWIDIDCIGNKNTMSNATNKFIKEFDNYFLINSGLSSIFNNDDLNILFKKFFKNALIIISLIKISATEFVFFDNVVKIHLKKNINLLCEIICLIFGTFIIHNKRESFYYRKDLVEKIEKISKSALNSQIYRKNGKIQVDSIISSLTSKYNHLSLNLRSFSNSFFNTITFQPFHKILVGLIDHIDDFKLEEYGDLVINHVLYAYLNKDLDGNNNNEVSNNVSNTSPFLPIITNKDLAYTLILDLDETLIHYFITPCGGTFFIRPGAHNFLKELSKYYEIVIFTAGTKEYADKILNIFDKNNLISYRLYRNHTTLLNDFSVKDLNLIGRNLDKTIFIDNIPDNFRNLPNNGFGCITWTNEISDKQLYDLKRILLYIADNKVDNVKDVIKKINELATITYRDYVNPFSHIDLTNLQ